MDLALYSRVLWRFRFVVAAGAALGVVLAILSYYSVSFAGGKPSFTPRKAETWQTSSSVFLSSTQPVQTYTDPGRYIAIGPLYAKFANSDAVKKVALRRCGRLNGGWQALPAADTTFGAVSGLPIVNIIGTGPSPAAAARAADCGTQAFLEYMRDAMVVNQIPKSQRVEMTVINAPSAAEAFVVVPRKKTLPIVVFMAVFFATIGLAFVLENARPGIRVLTAEDAHERSVKDVRRSA